MVTEINIVLLIDDSDITSSRIVSMLEDANNMQVVLRATNSNEALKIMEELSPDYIIIDIALSGKTGMSLLEEIRDKHEGSKVVVITNLTSKHYKVFCESMGVNYFLDKTKDFEMIPQILAGNYHLN
jgi:DNA-binding NarL/FixJ family response regulator